MQKQLELLKKYGIRLTGARGQHFLIDPNIQRKIVSLAAPQQNQTVLEIGPGLGAITEEILKTGAHVVAVEKDRRFFEILTAEYTKDYPNLRLIDADILSANLKDILPSKKTDQPVLVVGNIPYYITTPIFLLLIAHRHLIRRAVLMVQKEIADRITAKPRTKHYGRFTLLAQFYCRVKNAFEVSPACFIPQPKVKSAVLDIQFLDRTPDVDETLFFRVTHAAFNERRKNVLNALSHGFRETIDKAIIEKCLKESGIIPTKRAEELPLEDFTAFTRNLNTRIS